MAIEIIVIVGVGVLITAAISIINILDLAVSKIEKRGRIIESFITHPVFVEVTTILLLFSIPIYFIYLMGFPGETSSYLPAFMFLFWIALSILVHLRFLDFKRKLGMSKDS